MDSTSCGEVEVVLELEVAKREQSTHSLSPWRRHDPVVTEVEEDEEDAEDATGS